jgi:putative endonuclease
MTNDLDKRLWQHETGYFPKCYTYKRRPLVLKYMEHYIHVEQAKAREHQIKGWTRAKKEALMKSDWDSLKMLAQNYTQRFGG